jgi:non-homologous end joining protein Ku
LSRSEREAVDSSNRARGYEVGENEFLLVEDHDVIE